jgi:hypothetical protein
VAGLAIDLIKRGNGKSVLPFSTFSFILKKIKPTDDLIGVGYIHGAFNKQGECSKFLTLLQALSISTQVVSAPIVTVHGLTTLDLQAMSFPDFAKIKAF